MVRLLALVVFVSGLISLGLVAARTGGERTPPGMAALFTNPDGSACPSPCLLGVRPGQTSAQAASVILQTHPLTQGFTLISADPFRLEADGKQIVMITFNAAPGGIVDEITLATFTRFGKTGEDAPPVSLPVMSVGSLYGQIGRPDFVQITAGGDPVLVYSAQQLIASAKRAAMADSHMEPLTPLNRLTLFQMIPCPANAFDFVFLTWPGLVPLRNATWQPITYTIRRMTSAGVSFAPCRKP